MNFSGVITIDSIVVYAKGQGQRSKSQPNLAVSGPKFQFEFTYGDEIFFIVK